MKFWLFGVSFLLAVPWLMGAAMGPIAQMGSWLVSALVLVALLVLTTFLFAHSLRSRAWARFWADSFVIAACVSLCLGLLQYFGWAAAFSPWVAEAAPGEMLGNLRQRNQLAALMVMGLLALLLSWRIHAATCAWARGSRFGAHQLPFILVLALAALLGTGNALSGSRTGLLQGLAVVGLAVVWHLNSAKLVHLRAMEWPAEEELATIKAQFVLGAACVGYVLGLLAAPWLSDLLGHANAGLLGRVDDANAFSRIALWSNVLDLIAQKPLLGHGWRSLAYAHYSTAFEGARFMEMLDNAHNLPLHLAVELGLPVAVVFCALVGWLIWKNKPWAETRADRQLAWGILMVIGIHSLVEYPLWYGPFFMTALICIGILCGDLWRDYEQKWLLAGTEYAWNAIILGVRGVAVLLLAGTAYVAFDYHRVSQIYLQPEERSAWYAGDPLGAAKKSVFFQSHAKFAELQITPLSRENAPRVLELSAELVYWSPEPRIIEKLIESSTMLGLDDLAAFHLQRYRVAYPAAYAVWAK